MDTGKSMNWKRSTVKRVECFLGKRVRFSIIGNDGKRCVELYFH